MLRAPVVEPVSVRLKSVGGTMGLHDLAEDFDYACNKARGEAIDQLVLAVFELRGWSLSDDDALDRVTVEHQGKSRARILVDGAPATAWWQDRVVTKDDEMIWHFEPVEPRAGGADNEP